MFADPQTCFLGVTAIIASPAMRRTMELVERIARTTAAVLIFGETGTGKEIVARAIHHYSLRSAKPWVDVNCGALPEQLMESELFGHERGAFSGADSVKQGLFEMAHTGTLFLDEIGELEPRMQVKLLRVLDGVPYYRVGGQKKVEVNTRILAATNQNLEEAVRTGRFRSDLYHRLNQCQLRVPPLRERQEDVVPIANYFLRQHSSQASFSEEAQDLLRAYPWPGNVRELRNAVIAALIHAKGYLIVPADLGCLAPSLGSAPRAMGDLRLEDLERDAILEALRKTGGHCEQAAGLLGISRRTLSRKLKMYGPEAREAFMEPLQPIERRSEARHPVTGEVHLRQPGTVLGPFLGHLMDVSATGFRLRHGQLTLASGQLVDFSWDGGSGQARVVWTRILGTEAETGFHIVNTEI